MNNAEKETRLTPRKKVVRLPGQAKKAQYKDGSVIDRKEQPDASCAMAPGRWGASKYWQLRLDEIDKFSDVRVFDTDGVTLIRTVAKKDLTRPMPLREGQTWNNYMFLDRR